MVLLPGPEKRCNFSKFTMIGLVNDIGEARRPFIPLPPRLTNCLRVRRLHSSGPSQWQRVLVARKELYSVSTSTSSSIMIEVDSLLCIGDVTQPQNLAWTCTSDLKSSTLPQLCNLFVIMDFKWMRYLCCLVNMLSRQPQQFEPE